MQRSLLADNPGALTLDGTRTYIVGRRRVAVIDPGPALIEHIDAVVRSVKAAGDGVAAVVLLTHSHPDHAEGARAVAEQLNAEVRDAESLRDGERIGTDTGMLRALATPGHTADHFCFELIEERILFCGDLMMGGLDTALVAVPEGNLSDYIESLNRMRNLRPVTIHPAHGPDIHDADAAIARYIAHRHVRAEQVRMAIRAGATNTDALVSAVYGSALEPGLRGAAGAAVRAYVEWLEVNGRLDSNQRPIK